MNEKYQYLIKNTTILTISNFSSKLLVFFLVPLYTKVLTPQEYGIFDIITSTISLLLPILTLNIVDGVLRFSLDNKESKTEVASIGFLYSLLGCILFSLIILLNYKFNILPYTEGLELLIVSYMFCHTFEVYLFQLAKGLEKVLDMGIAGILGTITSLSLNVYFLLGLKLGLKGFFLAYIAASAIQILYYIIRLKTLKLLKLSSITKTLTKQMIRYAFPLALTAISWWINSAADKYIVTLFCGIASNGLLAVSYKIPTILNTIQQIFIQAWQISAIKEIDNGNEFYIKMFSFSNLIMCFSCSLLIILTRPLASFLFSNEFYQAWQYVPLLLVASVINGAAGFIGPILTARKDSKSMAKSAIYGSVSNIILNVILTKYYGIQGALIATVISSYVIFFVRNNAIGSLLINKHYYFIMLSWILLLCQSVVEIYSQNYIYHIFIIIIIFAIYKNSLYKLINKLNVLKK